MEDTKLKEEQPTPPTEERRLPWRPQDADREIFRYETKRRMLLALRETKNDHSQLGNHVSMECFVRELQTLLSTFGCLDTSDLTSPAGEASVKKIVDLCVQYIGADGIPFALGLFMSALGEGSVAQNISDSISSCHARAVIQYIVDHPETYTPSAHEIPVGNTGK